MSGLVEELQRDALNRSVHVSDLLRKALVVARKLNLNEFKEWISLELNGYPKQDVAPEYRTLKGEIQVWNPYHGWIPYIIRNAEQADFLSTGIITQRIGEIENLVARSGRDSSLQLPYPPAMEAALMKGMDVPLRPILHIDPAQVHGILEAVRNIILEWSLKLEQEGILGEGMTFSQEEKSTAATTTFHIQNMYHSQIQHAAQHSIQTMTTRDPDVGEVKQVIESLKPIVDQLGLDEKAKAQLVSDIQTVEPQLSAPQPKHSVVKECLLSIKTILEGAAGGVLASKVLENVNNLLSFLPR